jgi:hypothetical protein
MDNKENIAPLNGFGASDAGAGPGSGGYRPSYLKDGPSHGPSGASKASRRPLSDISHLFTSEVRGWRRGRPAFAAKRRRNKRQT